MKDDDDDQPLSPCYGNVTVYKGDLKLLDVPNWINDRIISFYAEYLNRQCTKAREQESDAKERVFCVDPSLVFWLLYCSDWKDCKEALKSIPWKESHCILFPMSDSDSLYSPDHPLTGSHWTLLAFITTRNLFLEYDSLHKAPSKNGKAFAAKLEKLLDLDSNSSTYCVETVPTQTNNYDCGIYVISIMELFVQFSGPPPTQYLYTSLGSNQLLEKREQVKQLIRNIFNS
ncbi:hypothetical protein GpartN1_g2712.t1 [Galdieria partita]|uniref:Ubiquitin-like protease family profile domain-containing protein n=1 Tax=Galdieria partita TaxID=83374 RepID=A0A9C7PW14_9RHOD|nr:hypothetical protein GpartN1_g2712.t1 [Galdieria partita]